MTYDDELVITMGDWPPVAPDARRGMPSEDRRAVRGIFGRGAGSLLDRIRVALRPKEMTGGALCIGIGLDPGSSGKRQWVVLEGFCRISWGPPGLPCDFRAPHASMLPNPAQQLLVQVIGGCRDPRSSSHAVPMDPGRDRTATSWR